MDPSADGISIVSQDIQVLRLSTLREHASGINLLRTNEKVNYYKSQQIQSRLISEYIDIRLNEDFPKERVQELRLFLESISR